jgi:predicted ArsR family transcriptional regulator
MKTPQIPGQLDIYGNEEPEPPAQQHSATSKAAAAVVRSEARNLRQLVLDTLRREGALTDSQIAERTGINENTARPRRIELTRNGEVKQAGQQKNANGRMATLWCATRREGEAL